MAAWQACNKLGIAAAADQAGDDDGGAVAAGADILGSTPEWGPNLGGAGCNVFQRV